MKQSLTLSIRNASIRARVARHPLIAFVVLAYTISWIAWHFMWFLDMGAVNGFSIIAGAGPALSATIISAILRPEQTDLSREKRWRLFGMIWIGYLCFLALRRFWATTGLTAIENAVVMDAVYPHLWAFLLDALAAATGAFFFAGVYSRWEGVRDFMRSFRLRERPLQWYWYLFAAGSYPAVVAIGNLISVSLGQPTPAMRATGAWYWLVFDVILWYRLSFSAAVGWRNRAGAVSLFPNCRSATVQSVPV